MLADGLGVKRSRRRQQNRRSPGPDKSQVQTLAGYALSGRHSTPQDLKSEHLFPLFSVMVYRAAPFPTSQSSLRRRMPRSGRSPKWQARRNELRPTDGLK
jgi:hypothetical protein